MKALPKQAITGHASRDKNGGHAVGPGPEGLLPGCQERSLDEIGHNRILKTGSQVQGLLSAVRANVLDGGAAGGLAPGAALFRLRSQACATHVVQDGRLKPGEAEVQGIASHPHSAELKRARISEARKLVNNRTAGIAQGEQLGDLVERLPGGVVAGAPERRVGEDWSLDARLLVPFHTEQAGVATRDYQRDAGECGFGNRVGANRLRRICRELHGRMLLARHLVLKQHRVYMPFEVVHTNQRFAECTRQSLPIGYANQQRTDEPRTLRDGESVKRLQRGSGAAAGLSHHRDNFSQVFARGEFRHYAPVLLMSEYLGGNHVGENTGAIGNDGGRGFVTTRLDSQHQHRKTTPGNMLAWWPAADITGGVP